MRTAFDIQPSTRTCAATGRPLAPGEKIVSAVLDADGPLVRKEFAASAWAGPPAGTVAFWPGTVPTADRPKRPPMNDQLLADCFDHLAGHPDPTRQNFRYVLALLLMRRKRLKFEDVRTPPGGPAVLVVRDAKTGARHEVPDPKLSDAETEAVQAEVFQVLGWD